MEEDLESELRFHLDRHKADLIARVTHTDPLTFILISLALAGAAMLARRIPARRATRVDPMVALRRE